MEIKEGVNYDFVLVAKYEGSEIRIDKIQIQRNLALIKKLVSMLNNDNYDAADMYKRFYWEISNYEALPYCLKHEYYDSYISDIEFPEMDIKKYRQDKDKFLEKEYNRKLKFIYRNKLSSKEYEEKKKKAKADADVSVKKIVQKDKEELINRLLVYIYAHDYHKALKNNCILDKYDMFSNEIHGRFVYSHEINDDIKIKTSTNFCYGSASYFHIIVSYKGIDLLPYSVWIKYYYAGFNELLGCTRSYMLNRKSWEYCMNFIKTFVGKALADPDRFIKEDVMLEVNELMNGLEEIYDLSDSTLRNRLEVSHIDEDETRYIGIRAIRHSNSTDKNSYSVSPKECALVYRMEKISGSLRFLKSLRSISSLYSEVEPAINRIAEMNRDIYPELCSSLIIVSEDLLKLKNELEPQEKSLTKYEHKLDILNSKLLRRLEKADLDQRTNIRKKLLEVNPYYHELERIINELKIKINQLRDKIYRLDYLRKRLLSFKELIENSKVLPS